MSKFYQTGSDSESELSEEETEIRQPKSATNAFQFSGDEEETKRVVRSAKEKRYEELTNIIKQVRNHKKIKDMSKLLTAFENLCRAYSKTKTIVDKENGGVVPQFYIHCLVELDNFVIECWDDREGRKNMSKNNSKSLTTLRQKLRKYNKEFEEEFRKYRLIPQVKDETDESDKESDSDNFSNDKKLRKAGSSKKSRSFSTDSKDKLPREEEEDGNDDDSVDWGSSSDEEASSSSDDERFDENLAAKFLKKTTAKESEKKIDIKEKKKKEKKEEKPKKDDENEDDYYDDGNGEWEHVYKKVKMFDKDDEINLEAVVNKLFEIVDARGRKGTDRSEQVNKLIELYKISENHNLGPPIAVGIMFNAIQAIFDHKPNLYTCMESEMWIKCLFYVELFITKLIDESVIVGPSVPKRELEDLEKPIYVRGHILFIADRIQNEFVKWLQGCDAHSTEYIERLKDEKKVCEIIIKFQSYYELEDRGTPLDLCNIYLLRMEHIYYKFDIGAFNEIAGLKVEEETSLGQMNRLCKFIFTHAENWLITGHAMLFYIYHLALHDNWYRARDLMLMSKLQLSISIYSEFVQILHNHTIVQLGLCAFRQGHIKDAHDALQEIQSGGRAKELLAQGILFRSQHERNSEQEKIEKSHQLPFHMHVNLELLECVYLVSAMLTEIPQMAAHNFDSRQRRSKSFHYHLKKSEKQPLVGPPDSTREHVVAASKAMKNGNWKACKNLIINDKMNSKVWKLFRQPDKVRDVLTQKIKEESLRTYVCTNSSVYSSLSIDVLSDMFELDKSHVQCTVCKMIGNGELMASLHEPSQTVTMHHTEPSRLQSVALQLADKVIAYEGNIERRITELKTGMFPYEGRGGRRGRR